ncbi:BrnT family toxin [Rhizobium tumorigenes]|uniref:BrnT family toxin n=1 Tax=Rhizobium tumorigenes TaxID=2041385 RepID=A0AAF1KW58_9HYPH|nr:BrnT family toxin [Rhizobium tumorigenes]WFR95904.1 BrnT family toxin [Rhizobium tumorigenes]
MKITWDERKRDKNIEKHDLDFGDLDLEFFTEAMILDARNGRLKAIGLLANDMVAVIFVRLGRQGISLISLRPASRKERSLYDQYRSRTPYPH